MGMTPAQEVISYLINAAIGVSSTSSRPFRDAPPGCPDTLLVQCVKWFFRNGDFSNFYEDIKYLVKGSEFLSFKFSKKLFFFKYSHAFFLKKN